MIETKLRPPRLREGYITRPRLVSQLEQGLAHGFILISAPAGYGKTSLVVDWLSQRSTLGQRPASAQRSALATAWVSLDENDNDLDSFLHYVTTAVHNAFAPARPCAKTQSLLGAHPPPPADTIASTLINDLARLSRPLLLILDDYHLIAQPAIQEVMATLVRHLPAPLRLLLITRSDPALPLLARHRAKQQLLEIRAADLRFVLSEARAILTQITGGDVDETTTALLEEQTDGWVLGLQLAGLSLRDQENPAAFVRAFQGREHRLVMDFLLDEVLAHQPRPVLDLLLKTAILERLCDSLCAAVVGERADGERPLLADLASSGLFLVALDEEATWFRYHHLFRGLLLRRQAQEWGQAEIAGLHQRAGAWLAVHGYIEEALRHFLTAGDVDVAVTLVEDRRHDLLNEGEMHRLNQWLGLLPEEVVAQRPALLQLKAWILRWQAKFQAVPALLEQSERLLEQEMDRTGGENVPPDILRAERDVLRAEVYFSRNEFSACVSFAQSALEGLPRHCFFARGVAAMFQLLALQSLGQTKAALHRLNIWLQDEQLQHHAYRYLVLLGIGAIYGTIGDLVRLEQVGRYMLNLGLAEEKPLTITWASHFLGHVYYHWNRPDAAYAHWSTVLAWRYQANFHAYHEATLGLALLHHARGDQTQARQTLDTLTQVSLEMNQMQFIPELEALRARLALLRDDVDAAVHWMRSGTQPARMPLWYWETNELTRVKVLLAQGTATTRQEAAHLLATCQQQAEATANAWLLIQIWALRGLLAQAQDQTEEALAAAEQAVRLAEPGGYLRLFVELGPDMGDLLAQLAERAVAPAYIDRILAVFRADNTPEPEALTRRELQILTLLRQGLSDRDIAERLVLSVLTVKKHNRHIYQKLGVSGRRAAIAKAKTLNLID